MCRPIFAGRKLNRTDYNKLCKYTTRAENRTFSVNSAKMRVYVYMCHGALPRAGWKMRVCVCVRGSNLLNSLDKSLLRGKSERS